MKYIRTMALVVAVFITASTLLIAVSSAADGPYMSVKDLSVKSVETSSQKHEVLMIKVATPQSIEISVGDTVTWRNLQRPKFPIVLISDEGLWDDQTIYYGKIFSYAFEEPGTYTFSAMDNPAISGTVVVNEKRMSSVVDTSADERMMVPGPEAVMGDRTGAVSPMRLDREQAMSHGNDFLIVRVATPTALEAYVGETVTWKNLQRPKFPIVLVSEEGLWDDQTIYYGKTFSYTFEESGTYTFHAQDKPAITGTVVVIEKGMTSVVDTPVNGGMMAPGPEAMMGEEVGEPVRSMEQEREQVREQIVDHSTEFLIIRIATPGSVEVDAGETVTWRNLQRPKLPVVLVSDDGLWEDQTIYYGKIFTYTFEEPGIYTFSVANNAAIKGIIVVK
ncbi:hypothetical protein [Methanolobus sp. ZRKC5]|uniref:hypothetical protein n=1 Tax=unclassified Methanolobus TaxID=2629569 RepID=UPI00313C1793